MSFYGLSVDLWTGRDVTGTALGSGSWRLIFRTDGETVTLNAGDAIVVATYGPVAGDNRPTVADDVAISWVLEVDQASAGTVRLSTGKTTGATISEAACDEDLGTFDAVGGQAVVAPQTSFTVADYLGGPVRVNSNLLIECTSGTVVLQQAKLRVWPKTGALGGWSLAYDTLATGNAAKTGRISQFGDVIVTASGRAGTMQESVDAAIAAAQDTLGTLAGTGYASSMFDRLIADGETAVEAVAGVPGTWDASARLRDNYGWIYARPEDYPATNPLGARDPNEVFDEPGAEVRTFEGAPDPVVGAFMGWTGSVLVSSITSVHSPPEDWTELYGWPLEGGWVHFASTGGIETADNTIRQYEPVAGGAPKAPVDTLRRGINPADQVIALPSDGGPCLVIRCRPRGLFDNPPTVVTRTQDEHFWDAQHRIEVSEGPDGLAYRIAYPTFQFYDPTGKPARKPRFFVTYGEVEDDPRDVSHVVGIGKPADDASIFRVPTPLGTLRELRHGEKVSDVSVAYPLKVKLEDGSWTVVAGMTPDD